MSLTHFFYEPFYSLSDFDRLFDEALDARQAPVGRGQNRQLARQSSNLNSLRPKMDVHEDKEKNLVTATFELPGLKKEDVQIDIHNSVLTVSGETKIDETKEQDGYAVRERRFGRFTRSIPVPQGIKEEEIKASLEDGVLNVTFPRSAPEAAPKKITVE
ncbi:small heat shock protein [Peniophora sp. CONT]|nr:small heat shock protein [Peniophora sp. CONT]